MSFIYKPRYGGEADMTRCREDVGTGWHGRQCSRKPTIERDGIGYCAQHDPVRVQEKREAWNKALHAQWAERDRAAAYAKALAAFKCEAVEALRQIADGYNDARGLALEIMAKEPKGGA